MLAVILTLLLPYPAARKAITYALAALFLASMASRLAFLRGRS